MGREPFAAGKKRGRIMGMHKADGAISSILILAMF